MAKEYYITPKNLHDLNIKALDQENHKRMYNKLKEDERHTLDMDFGDTQDKLRGEYLNMYEGVQSEVLNATRFDESSDLSTKYLGKTDMTRTTKSKAKEKFPISEQGYMV